MRGPVQWLARPRQRLLVGLEWVDVRRLRCLVLAARLRGRALPLLWAVYRHQELFRSQHNLEYGLLRLLRTMVPRSTQVVILADRGFGRAETARECQKLGFDYIFRINPEVYIQHPDFSGRLSQLPLRPGTIKLFHNVSYRKQRPVAQHVAVVWYEGQSQPWFLATNLPRLGAVKLTRIFAHRMSIEQYFRDAKSKRNGFGLRLTADPLPPPARAAAVGAGLGLLATGSSGASCRRAPSRQAMVFQRQALLLRPLLPSAGPCWTASS